MGLRSRRPYTGSAHDVALRLSVRPTMIWIAVLLIGFTTIALRPGTSRRSRQLPVLILSSVVVGAMYLTFGSP